VSDANLVEQTTRTPVFVRGCAHASDFRHASFPSDDYWRGAMGRAGEASFREAGALHAEADRQLRGQATGRQIAGAELIHLMTAAPQCSSIIYGGER